MKLHTGKQPLGWLLAMLICSGPAAAEPVHERGQFLVFGTLVEVTLAEPDPAKSAMAINALEELFRDLHLRLHPWLPGPLADLNAAIDLGLAYSAGPLLRDLIFSSQLLSLRSGGLFNPAIGRLVDLWGFHRPPAQWRPPAREQINALVMAGPDMNDLLVDGTTVLSENPQVKLDFGAVAKGYAVNAGLAMLQNHGITAAMINAGGDLGVTGQAAGGKPWRAAIRDPAGEGLLAMLDLLDGEALATSGDYERFHEYQGRKYPHLIDPHSGVPATAWASVTVLSNDGALSDAAATAIAIAGEDHWQQVAARMGVEHVLLVKPGGDVYLTPSMQQRVRLRAGIEPRLSQLLDQAPRPDRIN